MAPREFVIIIVFVIVIVIIIVFVIIIIVLIARPRAWRAAVDLVSSTSVF